MSPTQQERIDELARLLDGEVTDRTSIEAQRLLVLADAVRDSAPEMVRPTPAFKAQLRAQLIEQVEASQVGVLDRVQDAVRDRARRWKYSARVATASATASLMIGSAGAAVAAQSALPGELLYPVKQATESVRLALASSPEEVGRVQLDLARERLEELTEGVQSLSASQIIDLLAAMDRHTEEGAEELLSAFDRTQVSSLLEHLRTFTVEQRRALTAVLDELPLEAVPFADRSFELLRRIDVQSDLSAALCDCGLDGSTLAGASGAVGRAIQSPGEGPAAPDCDCVDEVTAPARDTGLLGGAEPGRGLLSDGASEDDGGTATDDGEGDGLSTTLGGDDSATEPIEELSETVDEVTETVDEATDPLESVTEPVEDATEELTEPIEDVVDDITGEGSSTETDTGIVEDTTTTVTDTVDETTDTVDDVATEVGNLLP